MSKSEACVDCQKQSPETETDYTLISAQFGWRLTRGKAADGSLLLEWRCPSCWAAHKRAHSQAVTLDDPSRQSSKPPPASTKRPKESDAPAAPADRSPVTSSGRGRPPR